MNATRGLAAGILAMVLAVPLAWGIAGIEGTFEYAIDAPWRVEPAAVQDGSPVYAIPINVSIHDENLLGRDRDNLSDEEAAADLRLGKVCAVVVRQRAAADAPGEPPTGPAHTFHLADFHEIEQTFGRWPGPEEANQDDPQWFRCRGWAGEDCTGFDRVGGTSEWQGLLTYEPVGAAAGSALSLQVEVRLTKDPLGACDLILHHDLVTLTNELRVQLAEAPLPRFGSGWLYGDLHYHSQGTDNEGESAYSYRGVLRAMSALGMDFAFATEHASNSEQIVDVDVEVGDVFDIHWPPHEERRGLRDMSPARFAFLHDLLNLDGGANQQAGLITAAGSHEPAIRLRTVPQIFLGGEVDLIPELPPGSHYGDHVPWGNEQNWSTENLCVGELFSFGPIDISCEGLGIHLLTHTATDPDAVLVDDIQGLSVDFARHHVVYLPRTKADKDAFVPSNTGPYGGARRRLKDLRPEFERHGYWFAAHPFAHYERNGDFLTDFGPNDIPWTDHTFEQAWASPAFLGLQFWNEDARLGEKVEPWSAFPFHEAVPAPDYCAVPSPDPTGQLVYLCPTPGDEIGYERHDSHVLGIPTAYVPVQNAQAGFGSGVFHLNVSSPVTGIWDAAIYSVEEKLHHGGFTWDRLNHWGLDIRKTRDLPWLPSFLAPRRLFMAGGSDAHGDLDYRRTGYLIRTEMINDAALGKPRNLVDAGAPGGAALPRGRGLDPVPVHTQDQVAEALAEGHFSITDGPALRIVADVNRDGLIDPGDAEMGDVVEIDATRTLPLLIEWKSTPEFGPVMWIDLYVGARSSEADFTNAAPAEGRTYAPLHPGVFHCSIPGYLFCAPMPDTIVEDPPYNRMNDNYWEDPTGLLRFGTENGFEGTKSVVLDLDRFPATQNRPADRFFVRAFAITDRAEAGCGEPQVRGGCLNRYAFSNPIWAEQNTFLCSAQAGLDTVPPAPSCNAPTRIIRQSLPQSITATAEDLCPASMSVSGVECFALNRNGVKTNRHCVVSTSGGEVTIERADGTGTIVSWTATATDAAGNSASIACQTKTENNAASASKLHLPAPLPVVRY